MPPVDVELPKWGTAMEDGTISNWYVSVGDSVEAGEPLAEVSTDKVDADVESPATGIVIEILASIGETIGVGTVIARIDSR